MPLTKPDVPRVVITPCSPVLPIFDDFSSSSSSSRHSSPTRHAFDPFLLETPPRRSSSSSRNKRRSSSSSFSTTTLSSLRSSSRSSSRNVSSRTAHQALAVAGLGLHGIGDEDDDFEENDAGLGNYDARRARRSGAISIALLFLAIVLVVSSTICSPSSKLFAAQHQSSHFDDSRYHRSHSLFHPYQQRHHHSSSSSSSAGGKQTTANMDRLSVFGLGGIPELTQKIGTMISNSQKWLTCSAYISTTSESKLSEPLTEAEHIDELQFDSKESEAFEVEVEVDTLATEDDGLPSGWDSRQLSKHNANNHRRFSNHALGA